MTAPRPPRRPPTAQARPASARPRPERAELHPRSRHHGRYDLAALVQTHPALAVYLIRTPYGDESIDFANPQAVQELNHALLEHTYGVRGWQLPEGHLCPAIPGRADYLHHCADLLATCNGGTIPRDTGVRVCDIGTGASCIYPLIGRHEYGWRFLASDISPEAVAAAKRILQANAALGAAIEVRLQAQPAQIFAGLWQAGENFDLVLCNPPFHASAAEAQAGTERKWRNLGKAPAGPGGTRNFGGQAAELWCPGGEVGFIARMITESVQVQTRCLWFTALVAQAAHLPALKARLSGSKVAEHRVIDMTQGQKRSRILAWTFLDAARQEAWRAARWAGATPPRPAPPRR